MYRDLTSLEPTDASWAREFIAELELRRVRPRDVDVALGTALAHLRDTGEGAFESFGNPRAYAASLGLPEGHFLAPQRTLFVAPLAVTMTSAGAFTDYALRWIDGDDGTRAIAFTLVMGALMLLGAAAWTASFARIVIDAARRQEFTGEPFRFHGLPPTLVIAAPWLAPIITGSIIAIALLR